jgi:hypothetical protein
MQERLKQMFILFIWDQIAEEKIPNFFLELYVLKEKF